MCHWATNKQGTFELVTLLIKGVFWCGRPAALWHTSEQLSDRVFCGGRISCYVIKQWAVIWQSVPRWKNQLLCYKAVSSDLVACHVTLFGPITWFLLFYKHLWNLTIKQLQSCNNPLLMKFWKYLLFSHRNYLKILFTLVCVISVWPANSIMILLMNSWKLWSGGRYYFFKFILIP